MMEFDLIHLQIMYNKIISLSVLIFSCRYDIRTNREKNIDKLSYAIRTQQNSRINFSGLSSNPADGRIFVLLLLCSRAISWKLL